MSDVFAGGTLSDRVLGGSKLRSEPGTSFFLAKRAVDLIASVALLPVFGMCCIVLLLLNPRRNPGSLFFCQRRMGEGGKPFMAWKFRTMLADESTVRGANDPLEVDRITKLGQIMRKTRIDELPQIINVLRGEMSLIGPRPDMYEHALAFFDAVPGYRDRVKLRPGISGLAQTEVGYVEGIHATRRKVAADLYYMANRSIRLEAWIFWRTISVIVHRSGA